MPNNNAEKKSEKEAIKSSSAALKTSLFRTLLFHPADTATKNKQLTGNPYGHVLHKTPSQKIITLYRGALPATANTFLKFGALSLLKPWQHQLHKELGETVLADIASGTSLSALLTVAQPLGTIKTRYQLGIYPDQKVISNLKLGHNKFQILKNEHLYSGSAITFGKSSVFLTTTALLSQKIEHGLVKYQIAGSEKMPTLEQKALSTFGGGISGMVAMMPFDYIKSWQQADRNKTSAMTISKNTLKKLGIKGFFRGLRYNIPECFALGWFSYWQAQSEEPSSQQNELEKNTQEPSYLQKKI